MLMTWIEMLVLSFVLGGVAWVVLPEPRRVRVRTLGRFITGRCATQLERARFVLYAPRSRCSLSDGI